jgi:hypothetical protein
MRIVSGNYEKKDSTIRKIKMFVLEEDSESIKGIDLGLLSKEENAKLLKLMEEYETNMKQFMRAYRHIKKNKFNCS